MLNAIAAVFLGTTMSRHGEPRILATVVGVIVLGVLDNGLTQMSVDSYIRQVLAAALILLAVAASSVTQGRR
ncbi:Ribose transport system permease protein RbsC [compost metagenome]